MFGHHVRRLLRNVGYIKLVCSHHILITHLLGSFILNVDVLFQVVVPCCSHVEVVYLGELHLLLSMDAVVVCWVCSLRVRWMVCCNAKAFAAGSS